MAGAGWRQFTVGQLLTSAQVQTFLQDQSVQVHASAAARSSALGTAVSAGMVSYRADDKALELYANSSWTPIIQGRNAVINGAMDFWQRGTSFAHTNTNIYGADRWGMFRSGFATGLSTSRQSPGSTLPQFQWAMRVQRDSGNTSTAALSMTNTFENRESLPFAGQRITLSFYARAGANFSSASNFLTGYVISGTGTDQNMWNGFTGYAEAAAQSVNLTTSWQRFTITGTVASTATQLGVYFTYVPVGTAGANDWFEITGVELEQGSVATPFTRAGGTLQGELAACQRYYERVNWTKESLYAAFGTGIGNSTTVAQIIMPMAVDKRIKPQSVDFSGPLELVGAGATHTISSITLEGNISNTRNASLNAIVASGLTSQLFYYLRGNNSVNAFVGISSEL
jgi:hypothetical protein